MLLAVVKVVELLGWGSMKGERFERTGLYGGELLGVVLV